MSGFRDHNKLISKQQYEAQLQQIFRLLLENKTQEEIAHELNISTRTVARYSQRIDQRYGEIQRQKNDDTLFLECHIFKNRMLNLYKALETKVLDDKSSGVEKAKCAEVAANIAIDVLKMESEGIRAVKELSRNVANQNTTTTTTAAAAASLNNLRYDNNNNNNNDSNKSFKECNPNRKF
jgi:ABC-type microcin C transport system duplicated ATPase subunit YejF